MKKAHTSKTKTIRERYGLTQRELAQYLGVSAEHLGMYEQNKRTLPTEANAKATQMMIHHNTQPADPAQALQAAPDKTWKAHYIKTIKKAIYQKKKKLMKAEKELQNLQKTFAQAVHMAHYIQHHEHNKNADKGDKLWHAKHGGIASLRIKKHGLPAQLLLQLEAENLKHYIERGTQLVQQLENEH